MLAVVLVLAVTTNLALSQVLPCSPSSFNITHISDVRLCNDSDLSILFNVSDSCHNIMDLYYHVYHHNASSGGSSKPVQNHPSLNYSEELCGVNATLDERVRIKDFNHTSLLQMRLRDVSNDEPHNEVICSNNFHLFLDYTGFLGPPVNINSNSYNCSFINVTWSDPDYQCGIEPVYYNVSIYDTINGSLVDTVTVDGTSYQFEDNDLFIHRYTYVITGVNELGEGISNNDTFSYQRVPKSAVEHTTLDIYYTQDMATIEYNIPVEIECTGEAPENATVTIQCNGTGVVYDNTTEVKYEKKPRNITGLISVPQYQQCNISIVFSNEAGSSEPFILVFDTTPPRPPYVTSSLPIVSVTPTSGPTYTSSSSPTVSVTPIVGPASDPLTMTTGAIIGIASGCFVVVVTLVLLLIGVVVNCGKNIGAAVKLIKVTKQRDKNGITDENVAHDGGNDVHVQVLDNAAGQYGGQGQGEVVPNGEGQDEVQEVLQNPLALVELKDVVQGDKTKKNAVRQEQGDGSVEQGIVRTEALVNNADTATPLAQDPVPEPKEVAQTDMIEKQTPRKQDEDNTKSKSNDKEIESADNARDSKKPTKDKYHKDTYHLKRQLLDPSTCSSVPEPYVDQSEYNAYYDEPIVTGEAGGIYKETETSDNDQQLPRQFVTISIPRPTAGDHSSAIISGTLYKDILVPVLPMIQTSLQEIPSLRQIAQPNPQINEENKDFQSEPFDDSTIL